MTIFMLEPQLYFTIFLHTVILMSLVQYSRLQTEDCDTLLTESKPWSGMLLYAIAFIVIVGLRPVSAAFGDTVNYARTFEGFQTGIFAYDPDSKEWLFDWLMSQIARVGDVHDFFLLIEIFYIVPMLLACHRLFPHRTTIGMLFCLGAFSFFTYGTNGIRNGMACSLILWAYTYMHGSTKDKVIAAIICFCAYNVHKSSALPIVCMIVAYFYTNTRQVLIFWGLSIVVSLVAGGVVESFFAGLGFDDRLSGYITANEYDDEFSNAGFRWDFLLYSVMPIWLGWYVVIKREIMDTKYQFLLNTYVLCNSFWVMLIRASFSNRFAYLSWFMYPIVLAYPLLCLPIWDDQGKKAGQVLMAHVMFTYVMWLLGK